MKDLQATGEALKREHPALQNNTLLHFFYFSVCVLFAHLDPDPVQPIKFNADPCESGSGSKILIVSIEDGF